MLGFGPLAFAPLCAVYAVEAQKVGTGTLAATLGALTGTLTGKVTVGGTAAGTLLPLALVATGTVANQVFTGTLARALDALTLTSAGKVLVQGVLGAPNIATWTPLAEAVPLAGAYALAPLTLMAFGGAPIRGTLGITLGALTATLTGKVTVGGTAAGTLLPLALVATGTVVNQVFSGTLAATLGPATLVGIGKVAIRGTLGVTLAPVTLAAATGAITTAGTLGVTLGALTGTLTGKVTARGTAAGTLLPLMLVGTGTVRNQVFTGTLARTLNPVTLAAAGIVSIPARIGTLAVTLQPLTLAARGFRIDSVVWPHEWCPVAGAGRTSPLAVETVLYGDGYTHRATRGLNPVRPTMDYAFPFVGLTRLSQMDAFLKTYGVGGFAFSPPDATAPIWVSCDEWSASITDRSGADLVGSLRATFVEGFNA